MIKNLVRITIEIIEADDCNVRSFTSTRPMDDGTVADDPSSCDRAIAYCFSDAMRALEPTCAEAFSVKTVMAILKKECFQKWP